VPAAGAGTGAWSLPDRKSGLSQVWMPHLHKGHAEAVGQNSPSGMSSMMHAAARLCVGTSDASSVERDSRFIEPAGWTPA
jgi:hypothetical protein